MIDDRAFRPNTLDAIGKTEARFRSLGDASADATTARERLLLTFLGGIAEFERDLIRARTGEGRARAKARAVHMGRAPLRSQRLSAPKPCATSPKARRRRQTWRGGSMRAELRFHDWHMPKFDIHSQEERCVV